MNNPSSASIGIVGAGPGGLAAAMILAASGLRVTVYEKEATVGGRTMRLSLTGRDATGRAATELAAYHFDRGPTFFLMPYVLQEIFSAAGRRLADEVEHTRLDPMYRLVMGRHNDRDLIVDCTQDLTLMAKRLAAIDPADGEAFAGFIEANRAKLEVFTPVLRAGFKSFTDLFDPALLKAVPHLGPTRSVHADLGRHFKNPYVKLAMSFQSKYLGMSPFKCPSLFTILPFIEYEYGIWHPRGGCNALMDAMARITTELGGDVRCGSPVQSIVYSGTRATGVVVDNRTIAHDHVIINADASWAMKNLIPPALRRKWTDRKLDGMKYSCSTYMLYLGLRDEVDLPHHTIRIARDYEQNIREIAETMKLSDDPSVYVCNPSRTDPTLAPPGRSALYVLVPTPNQKSGIDWAREAPGMREKTLDRVSALIGRDVRPLIDAELQLTPADWQGSNINFGATFNLAHGLDQMLHLRPQHELPDVENTWLVGGGTHPGSGLPVIFLSSQITARRLCQRLGVPCTLDHPGPTAELAAAAAK
ncbi:MAG: phytoene desaturase family protein [Phycisphaerales bacterium]